jgi:hypothetical protein
VAVRICPWYGAKKAALSLRFDDSETTHIERALPMLNEFGFIGTFLVNPGIRAYGQYAEVWEGPVVEQGHELGDHTLHHEGARTDREAEAEIGDPAKLIHRVQPERKLVVFSPGGNTLWLQRKSFRFFIAKYDMHPRLPQGIRRIGMSCSEDYESFSPEAFAQRLDRAIAEGAWMEAWFHPIGEGHLHITPPTFRKVLERAAERRDDIWQASKGAITQYAQERTGSVVWPEREGDDAVVVHFACATDPDLYEQPLTLEVDLPAEAEEVTVVDADGKRVEARIERGDTGPVARFDAPPVDAVYTVRATGLGAAYAAERSAAIDDPGPHPYLFFTKADVPALLGRTSDPHAREMWEAIKQTADELAGQDLAEAASERDRWNRRRSMVVLSFAYALTGDPAYAQRALPEIESLLEDDSWHLVNADAHVTGQAIGNLALAYDWMHDALDEDLRGRMRDAIIRYGIEPMLETTARDEWWTFWYRCNWGAVAYGRAGVAALSLLRDEPRAAEWARLFRRKIWHYTQSIGDDGGWGESASYGNFAWGNALPFMYSLRRLTGGRVDLFDNPKVEHLSDWFINMLEPEREQFVPFSNCTKGVGSVGTILYRLGAEYRDGHAQFAARELTTRRRGPDIFGFLWYDPTVEPKPLADLPPAKLFRSIDWAMLRSDWEDREGVLFALKGGQKDWDHHHHDTNHFVLYAHGRPLIVDLHYPYNVWGCNTEAHNTIMVNGKEQRGKLKIEGSRGKPDHRGIVDDLVEAPWYARVVGDASLAYDQDDVNSYVREVLYLRKAEEADPPDYVVMFDDVAAAAPARMDWLLHTYGDLRVEENRITITQDQAAVDVTMIAPDRFTQEIDQKTLEEVRAPQPFEGAEAITYIKLRPVEPLQQDYFLSVMVPRRSSASSGVTVSGLREPNVLGARVVSGATEDVSLFALDAPEISAAGVTATGRTCFVRRAGGEVQKVVLHNGQRISADGALLFETSSSGNVVLTFEKGSVEAKTSLYSNVMMRIHSPKRPAKVLVNGEERGFEYETDSQCVRLDYEDVREVKIILP